MTEKVSQQTALFRNSAIALGIGAVLATAVYLWLTNGTAIVFQLMTASARFFCL